MLQISVGLYLLEQRDHKITGDKLQLYGVLVDGLSSPLDDVWHLFIDSGGSPTRETLY